MRYSLSFLFGICLLIYSQTAAQSLTDKLTTSINGTIIKTNAVPGTAVYSEDEKFHCTYEIGEVTDEMRILKNLKVYKDDILISVMEKIPGSDISITNSGRLIFYDHSGHYKGILKLHVYSCDGQLLFTRTFKDASRFEFSPSGEMMGIRTPEGISIIELRNGNNYMTDKGLTFSFDQDDKAIAVAPSGRINIYRNSNLVASIPTGIELPRKVIISSENNLAALIDKYNLNVYSITDNQLIFKDKLSGDLSFRDLKIISGKILSGIHRRNDQESTGILRIYDLNGNRLSEKTGESMGLQRFNTMNIKKKNKSGYDPIPWPFFPFDSMRTVWNHYEQHMWMGGTDSYLHQGLDLITPVGEHTYSVLDGYVKLVLTLGGSLYWRIAISDTQSAGRSNGWLSAHLIQNTIQFDVGDTVHIHDYLGDIIQWSGNWGHIHFVNISDSGLVWFYDDDEWGINFNPALALQPYPDVTPPDIENVFTWSKFAFAENESDTYLQPDSLFGEIDIIAKVVDYTGDSEWQQPAYSTFYTIKRISDDEIIKPRTMGHILNHKYPFFDVNWFMDYAGVIYQRDYTLLPPDWMSQERNFYHNLTNSNGDSLVELSEKSLAFNTDDYPDGDYRIIIEAYDEAGNSDIDSMDVKFKNGNPVAVELISFTAVVQNHDIVLNWATASELNNQGFEIQRGLTKDHFATIGFVEGCGTTSKMQNYSYTDKPVKSGKYFYRLKQVDFNGKYEYSNIIEAATVQDEFALEQNYPNPFNPTTNIEYRIPDRELVTLKVYDVLGNEVATLVNEEQPGGNYTVKCNGSNFSSGISAKGGYASGVYFYQLKAGTYTATKKLILMK